MISLVTYRGDDARTPDRAEFARRWSQAHGGAEPRARFVRPYLAVVHGTARPLARAGVPPDVLTLGGLVLAVCVLAPAAVGGAWALLVPVLVVVSALLDGLDGAVAVLTGRPSAWGGVLDGVGDRVADAAYAAALWLLGAPGVLAVLAGATGWLHEYLRARATAAGMRGVGVVSVGERPTRVVVVALFALAAGLYPQVSPQWATAGAGALLTLGLAGLAQLLPVVRRSLP